MICLFMPGDYNPVPALNNDFKSVVINNIKAKYLTLCEAGWVNFTCGRPYNNSLPKNSSRITKTNANNFTVIKNIQKDDHRFSYIQERRIQIGKRHQV